ncbi:reducing type I polyketide synthase [Phaeosphaeriaceae sp. PMI808]|nr:reducing type I polyketide synthase [Phaeosphaeriaceae sp. PMI808]
MIPTSKASPSSSIIVEMSTNGTNIEELDTPEPLAIIGLSFQFPGGAITEDAFWDLLVGRQCAASKFPSDRINIDAFHSSDPKKSGSIHSKEAHFLKSDFRHFDASFFSIAPSEAKSMDPSQRGLMETTYHALENAGILQDIAGSNTSVHVGCFSSEFTSHILRDIQKIPKYAATGSSQSILSNRISWHFDLKGPSMTIDTACSSSLVALDLACQGLWNKRTETAIVAGVNLILSPEMNIVLSNMNFLSPQGRCFPFDSRANGALRDGNTIRALIRAVGSNQDGRTNGGITQPSKDMQARLIQQTYRTANLDAGRTRFFEAHGTGTAVGDPIEARAIGEVFGRHRSDEDPIYVGTVKSNIGHLEGASGLAGIIKTILALEKGIIPPNANFRELNPAIDDRFFHLKFPQTLTEWPDGPVRRASINSFGFGGSNAHCILDDVYSYLSSRGLKGIIAQFHLFVFSASDEAGVSRQAKIHSSYLKNFENSYPKDYLSNYAYTLQCRPKLSWRSFSVVDIVSQLETLDSVVSTPVQGLGHDLNLGFVFTGQGSQWKGMGRELLLQPVFRESIDRSQGHLQDLGVTWSLLDYLDINTDDALLQQAQFSQVITTCMQLALTDLMYWLDITPSIVVGHSSGEIAAAYAAGHISQASAVKVSYFRGALGSKLESSCVAKFSMAAVGLSYNDARTEILRLENDLESQVLPQSLTISCINSPSSVTISGLNCQLGIFISYLEDKNVFARKLKVNLGYHSPQMSLISGEYMSSLGTLEPGQASNNRPRMISSVTGSLVDARVICSAKYWVRNLVSPVNFLSAMTLCNALPNSENFKSLDCRHLSEIRTNGWLEIGPHSTLKGPLQDILKSLRRNEVVYASALIRNTSALSSMLKAIGTLYTQNFKVDLSRITSFRSFPGVEKMLLPSIPCYEFNHSTVYWEEALSNRNFRNRSHPNHDLLGTRIGDPNPFESQWKFIINEDDMPWIRDHRVDKVILYPAAGMIVMAIEAAKQLAEAEQRAPSAWELENLNFCAPIIISDDKKATEVHVHLSTIVRREQGSMEYNFRIISYRSTHNQELACSGKIRADYTNVKSSLDHKQDERGSLDIEEYKDVVAACDKTWKTESMYQALREDARLDYGSTFQALDDVRFSNDGIAIAKLLPYFPDYTSDPSNYLVHPSRLDGVFHLCLAALGGVNRPQSFIPRRIKNMWIAASGLGQCGNSEQAFAKFDPTVETIGLFDITMIDASSISVKATIEGLELKSISTSTEISQTLDHAGDKCWYMKWGVDLDTLDTDQVQKYCEAARNKENEPVGWYENLRQISVQFGARTLQDLDKKGIAVTPSMERYASWLRAQLRPLPESPLLDNASLDRLCERLLPDIRGEVYIEIGRNLGKILIGDVDPLQLLFGEDSKMDKFYGGVNEATTATDPLSRYIDSLVHKSPDLKWLEIGAGTGSSTDSILKTIADPEMGPRYREYMFTDIGASFLSQAQEKFSVQSRMKFQTLDIERSPKIQGFEEGTYDVVIADNIFHATSNLQQTLQNVRGLLKPGGKLIMKEMTQPQKLVTGFVFGLLPGWWLASEKERQMSPCLSEQRWDSLLKASNFSGTDLLFRDHVNENCHLWSFVISTAVGEVSTFAEALQAAPTFIINNKSSRQDNFVSTLSQKLPISTSPRVITLSEAVALCKASPNHDFILLETGTPMLRDIKQEEFLDLQRILSHCRNILWVKGGDSNEPRSPDYDISDGLCRVVRHENPEITLITLALEDLSATAVDNIARVFSTIQGKLARGETNVETEYATINGRLCINRLSRAKRLNQHVFKHTGRRRFYEKIGKQKLRLNIVSPGILDTIEFSHEASFNQPILPDEAGVEVRAIGINFKDCLTLLGRVNAVHNLGSECSGIVQEVGSEVTNVKIGDRVVVSALGSFKTYIRAHKGHIRRIPDDMKFVEAAGIPTVYCTAYHSLVNIAHLQKGETVLIHSASGGVGQAAVQLAQRIGAEVFATVGSHEKKTLLMDVYGIKEDHILYSRNTSFARSIMRRTANRGVDVIINSLPGRILEASWECIAPFGRFVEIGLGDAFSQNDLPMHTFTKSASFSSVDLTMVMQQKNTIGQRLLTDVMNMFVEKKFQVSYPLHVYKLSEVEEAVRAMQSGTRSGKIVVEVHSKDSLPIVRGPKAMYSFSANATYVIAGGFGGIGCSIARWLVRRGARNLVLLSRSGPRGRAQEMMTELIEAGINIQCPVCDITDQTSLKKAIAGCSTTMPVVKGCFQAAMVLNDSTFSTMTFDKWQQATRPKVQGSWNLHAVLPSGMDFFILLSSVCGIFGNRGQSNYAAGNTYEDGLARYRVSIGEKAVSIDLGIVLNEGFVASNRKVMDHLLRQDLLRPNSLAEVFAMLDHYCDPNLDYGVEQSQVITGLELPVDILAKGKDIPIYMQSNIFQYMHGISLKAVNAQNPIVQGQNLKAEFIRATSTDERSLLVANALGTKLSQILGRKLEKVDINETLEAYGADSLVGLELRNWLAKETGAHLAVFEILSGLTLVNIGRIVTQKSLVHILRK